MALARRVYVAHHIDSPRTRIVFSVASRVVTFIDPTSECSHGYRIIRPREKSQWHAEWEEHTHLYSPAGVHHLQFIFDVSGSALVNWTGRRESLDALARSAKGEGTGMV